ncbi:hypothetical protein LO80_05100 [Candidatus Francisella endociliophora]|uniref:N-acetyltransferase domain-containing protein n=1 Tax=Candidatus Francisella endociliophora TaxID=653937 RepID=A0A097EPB1_9GAMM|nr:GNAT family N-acetyltransferase [Francisella sp. FSC1006]AIT09402.1 hypothetical protein LO80_05100 [Francisella sp. FSC1006]
MYKIIKVTSKNRSELSSQLSNLKKQIVYPLGKSTFTIEHGNDYFAYYENMGKMHYWCVVKNGEVIGSACGIVKSLELGGRAWYLCDLKVDKNYRGQGIARKLFRKIYLYMFIRYRIFRVYAISMNDPLNEGEGCKKLIYISNNFLKEKGNLEFFLLTKEQYVFYKQYLDEYSLTHTRGIKDIVFDRSSSGAEIYHLNRQKLSNITFEELPNDAYITISTYSKSELSKLFIHDGILPEGSAKVLTSYSAKNRPYIATDQV